MKHFLTVSFLALLLGCSQRKAPESQMEMVADTVSSNSLSSAAAVENPQDTTHKFVRTADLKFKVKDVRRATTRIEDITVKNRGFVTYTSLTSTINNTTVVAVSADSSLETTYYTVENDLVLRVPNTALDTTLREIARLVEYLDYRVIKADEVSLQYLSHSLAQKRLQRHQERLAKAIDNRGRKLTESTNAEDNLLSKQEREDEAKINSLQLLDEINFSTVRIKMYQRQSFTRELIENDRNIEEYEPGFFSKLAEAAREGWSIVTAVLLFFTRLWGLILLALAGLFVYLKYAARINKL